ncbi:MAG: imidazole glycerol phosphate synthase subunit HisH [Rhodospirillales bacterium]|nr:imidazole glycerol phosphate synthase subunit HisH [Rhodospirillales bacterium]
MKKVAIVDYGLGNLRSAYNAFRCFDVDLNVIDAGDRLADAHAIVVPGVGSFDAGIRGLRARGHLEALQRRVVEGGVAFFGICLGMQFVFESSEEGSETGLGWMKGRVSRFPDGENFPKVPHIGWADVRVPRPTRLFSGIESPSDFYFVHSYYVPLEMDGAAHAAGIAEYGFEFAAAVERDNICACQFHPEKSQLAGLKMIENFLGAL